MKKFFTAMIVLLMVTAQVEAAELTREQLDKVFSDIQKIEAPSPLHIDAEALEHKFNWFIVPIVQDGMGKDDISDIAHLFLINDYEFTDATKGKIVFNVFEYSGAAIFIMGEGEEEHSDVLGMCYTTPENQTEALYTIWLLTAFAGSISPDIDTQALMNELTAEGSSGSVVKQGLNFSITEYDNVNVLTVVAAH